jgi:hypothetical protein
MSTHHQKKKSRKGKEGKMLSFPTSISYRAKINRERFGHNDFGIFVSFLKTLEVNSTFEQRQKLG